MWSKIKQFFTKTDRKSESSSVSGRYISREREKPPTVSETVNRLFQFKAGENFGTIFELSNSPMQSIKSELDAKIAELKLQLEKADKKQKDLIAFAIRNIEELDIYEIKAINNELKREYICKYNQIGA